MKPAAWENSLPRVSSVQCAVQLFREQQDAVPERRMLGKGKRRIKSEQAVGGVLGLHEGLGVGAQIGHVHFRQTVLSGHRGGNAR